MNNQFFTLSVKSFKPINHYSMNKSKLYNARPNGLYYPASYDRICTVKCVVDARGDSRDYKVCESQYSICYLLCLCNISLNMSIVSCVCKVLDILKYIMLYWTKFKWQFKMGLFIKTFLWLPYKGYFSRLCNPSNQHQQEEWAENVLVFPSYLI